MLHEGNASVARTFVATQQMKGWFIAQAQQIAVWCSAGMMSLGVVLWYTGVKLELSSCVFMKLLAALPVIVLVIVFACFVEGMTITAASGRKEVVDKIDQELRLLERSKAKYPDAYTEDEYNKKKSLIEKQIYYPTILLLLYSSFSFLGGELFWNKLLEGADNDFIKFIGYVMGAAICAGLIYLETHPELVERGVDRSISSSHLIYRAMDMDAKGQVLGELSKKRKEKLKSAEFIKIIEETAKTSLFAPLSESLNAMGSTVTEDQLMKQVRGQIAQRSSANRLAKGLEDVDNERNTEDLPRIGGHRKNYNTEQQKRCKEIILKYGHGIISQDLDKFAKEAKVARATLVKALERVN